MSTPIRLAVIGAGHLGRFHAKLAAASPHFDLVGVSDPCGEARDRVAAEAGTAAWVDYRPHVTELDAAIVATPTITHAQIAEDLLARGVHVLVEKPLAPTRAEADNLVRLAEIHGAVLQVGHVERFNPAFAEVTERIHDPRFIQATRTSGYSFRSTDIGAVLDMMIHDIDLTLALAASPVVDVWAMGVSVLGGHEDLATAQLRFESGCVAQLTASRVSYAMQRTMQVFSSRGFAAIDFATRQTTFVNPVELVLRRDFDAAELSASERQQIREHLFQDVLVKSQTEAPPVNAIELELDDFARAIRTGDAPRVTGDMGREAVAVAEAILQQIEEHAWDGHAAGRRGPFAMPALPRTPTSFPWRPAAPERRKAG
jgi:predicted dehydrogenase